MSNLPIGYIFWKEERRDPETDSLNSVFYRWDPIVDNGRTCYIKDLFKIAPARVEVVAYGVGEKLS